MYDDDARGEMNVARSPERAGRVPEEIRKVDHNLDCLDKLIERAEEALGAILHAERSTPPSESGDRDPSPISSLGSSLADFNRRLIGAHARLGNLLDRLDL
jgi:hypothetical protein